MTPRIDYANVSSRAFEAMLGLQRQVDQSGLEPSLLDLVKLRASPLNGCGYYGALALPQWLLGAGIGAFFAPPISIAQGSLPPEQIAFGAGLINFLRITAGSFGASLVTTFWDRRAALHHSQLAEHVGVFAPQASQAAAQLGHSGLTAGQGLAQIDRLVTNQASMLAANDIFWISGWLFLVLIVSVWLTRKPFGAATTAAH